jgi:hypothetical protein
MLPASGFVHQFPLLPPAVLLSDQLVVEGTLKSCTVCVAPVSSAAMDGVVSVLVVLPDPVVSELARPLLSVAAEVAGAAEVSDGATKLMPVAEPVEFEFRLPEVIAAVSDVPDEVAAPADGLDPDPTFQLNEPLLDSSHGVPEAGAPPFRLMPMTYRFRSVVSSAHCPGGSPGVPSG